MGSMPTGLGTFVVVVAVVVISNSIITTTDHQESIAAGSVTMEQDMDRTAHKQRNRKAPHWHRSRWQDDFYSSIKQPRTEDVEDSS